MTKDLRIPPEFWKTITEAEKKEVFSTGTLTGVNVLRAWKMAGGAGKTPAKIDVMINSKDLEREVKRMMRSKK